MPRDRSLDTLLAFHDLRVDVDDAGHLVKIIVREVPPTGGKPHGLDYSLTLHAPDGTRLLGFDNAHGIGDRREAQDHRHAGSRVRPYNYTDAATLLTDFWAAVEAEIERRKSK